MSRQTIADNDDDITVELSGSLTVCSIVVVFVLLVAVAVSVQYKRTKHYSYCD